MTPPRLSSLGLVSLSLSLAAPSLAEPSFDDDYALPDAFAPPSLPDLTHRELALSFDNIFASIQPSRLGESSKPSRSLGMVQRLEAEQALHIRRWYLGAAMGLVSGSASMAMSQPEIWSRAIWASRTGLAFGGGMGLVFPTFALGESTRESLIEEQLRIIRPWDGSTFDDQSFTFRPFVDVRAIDGPVTLQLRQGIDWSMPLEGGEPRIVSRTTVYVGYGIGDSVQFGLEAIEVYFIRADDIKDDERATYMLSPSLRFMTRAIQPGISAIFPLDQNILGLADSFWAIRLQAAFVFEPWE